MSFKCKNVCKYVVPLDSVSYCKRDAFQMVIFTQLYAKRRSRSCCFVDFLSEEKYAFSSENNFLHVLVSNLAYLLNKTQNVKCTMHSPYFMLHFPNVFSSEK